MTRETDMTPRARILTIEDDWSVRTAIVAYLEDAGYEVLEAENGSPMRYCATCSYRA